MATKLRHDEGIRTRNTCVVATRQRREGDPCPRASTTITVALEPFFVDSRRMRVGLSVVMAVAVVASCGESPSTNATRQNIQAETRVKPERQLQAPQDGVERPLVLPTDPGRVEAETVPLSDAPTIEADLAATLANNTSVVIVFCASKSSRHATPGGADPEDIVTDYAISTKEVLSGTPPAVITIPGGIVGDAGYMIDHVPRLTPGSTFLVILGANETVRHAGFVRNDTFEFHGSYMPIDSVRSRLAAQGDQQ